MKNSLSCPFYCFLDLLYLLLKLNCIEVILSDILIDERDRRDTVIQTSTSNIIVCCLRFVLGVVSSIYKIKIFMLMLNAYVQTFEAGENLSSQSHHTQSWCKSKGSKFEIDTACGSKGKVCQYLCTVTSDFKSGPLLTIIPISTYYEYSLY